LIPTERVSTPSLRASFSAFGFFTICLLSRSLILESALDHQLARRAGIASRNAINR
jgi:hypothetical protein